MKTENGLGKQVRGMVMMRMIMLTAFLLVSAWAGAQVRYGFKVDAGGSCQSDLLEITNNVDLRFAYSAGLIARYNFTDGFAVKSGLSFEQKGREKDVKNMELRNKLSYLTLPVKAEFSAGEKAGFKNGQRIFFAAGPYVSYLLDANEDVNGNDHDITDRVKDFDYGMAFELGFEFPAFDEKTIQLGLNYDMGFVEVYENEPDLHNKMATISMAILF